MLLELVGPDPFRLSWTPWLDWSIRGRSIRQSHTRTTRSQLYANRSTMPACGFRLATVGSRVGPDVDERLGGSR